MARKPAKMYRRIKGPAFTRRKYMGGVPNNRILSFHSGNRVAAETGQFKMQMDMYAEESCQIQSTALEAARVIANATIRNAAGIHGYALRIHTYPHQVLRENKQATGAGCRPCITRYALCFWKERRHRSSCKARTAVSISAIPPSELRRSQGCIAQGQDEVPNSLQHQVGAW